MEFYIPETKQTVKAKVRPVVIITSNAEKEDVYKRQTIYWFRFFIQSRVYCRCSIVSLSHLEAMEKYRSLSAAGQRTACRS